MTAFVLFCAVLALVAIFIVAYPLLRPLPALAKGEPAAPKAAPLAFAVSVIVAVAAAVLYGQITNFPWDNPIAAKPVPADHGEMAGAGSMEEAITALEARLAANPNDGEGWRMLGRTYLISGNAAKAVEAYDKAAGLTKEKNVELELDIAEALVLTEDPALQPRAKSILDAALAANPGSQKALWYQGVMAMRSGDTEVAKRNFTTLLGQNPPAEIREVLVSQLRELGADVPASEGGGAVAAMGGGMGAAGAMGAQGSDVAPKGRTIRVKVSLDPALAAKLKPDAPLFVSAREPGIPGPPIAAVRLTASQLPMTVVLSDANTMIEGRDLSSVSDVEVVARVAFSGTPAVSTGDLLGSAVHKKGGGEDLDVVIARVQP